MDVVSQGTVRRINSEESERVASHAPTRLKHAVRLVLLLPSRLQGTSSGLR